MQQENEDMVDGHQLSNQEHPLWKQDHISLKSVGIDIGSSTSHLIFSTLELRRQSAVLSSRFQLAGRRVDYESPILITPFIDGSFIDTDKLSKFFKEAYSEAGITPDQVDTGAVITTGDAARKDNAEAIVRMFSKQAGKFVCASAGPILEAKMAAYGSGAVARSVNESNPITVLNIDVGGGTAKLAIVRDGNIIESAAMNVGARLVTFDKSNIIIKIEQAASVISEHHNLGLEIGHPISDQIKEKLSFYLARSLMEVAVRGVLSPLTRKLMVTNTLKHQGDIDLILFSGGVSEYLYGVEQTTFGDIGTFLGNQIKSQVSLFFPTVPIETPLQRIRATVIGASQFTVQVSGNTIYIANSELLPLRNLQVVTVKFDSDKLISHDITNSIQNVLSMSEVSEGENPIALAIEWSHGPAYPLLRALCLGIIVAMKNTIRKRNPIVLVLDCDIARLVGTNLSRELNDYKNIICIDGVTLQDFDYIDISKQHSDARVVTVVIKSLVFTG